jgi:hypothetical protein
MTPAPSLLADPSSPSAIYALPGEAGECHSLQILKSQLGFLSGDSRRRPGIVQDVCLVFVLRCLIKARSQENGIEAMIQSY